MKKTYQTFSEQLNEALTLSKKRQTDLANHLGVHKQQIYRWLHSEIIPREEMVQKISAYLNYQFKIFPREFSRFPKDFVNDELLSLSEEEAESLIKIYIARDRYLREIDKVFFTNVSAEVTSLLIPEITSLKLRLDSICEDLKKKTK